MPVTAASAPCLVDACMPSWRHMPRPAAAAGGRAGGCRDAGAGPPAARGGTTRLVVLHQRHHRPASGRDAHHRNLRWRRWPPRPWWCSRWHPATPSCTGAAVAWQRPAHLPYVMNGGVNVIPASGGPDEAEFFDWPHWRAPTFAAPTIVKRLADHVRATGRRRTASATIVCRRRADVRWPTWWRRAIAWPAPGADYGQARAR